MRQPNHSSPHRLRLALCAVIAVLGLGGYVVCREAIRNGRDAAATRRAAIESVHVQALLARARAYVAGLSSALAAETAASQRRFAALAGTAAGTVGLDDVLWIRRGADGSLRIAYRIGGVAQSLRPGTDVSAWPGLGPVLRTPGAGLAVTATALGAMAGRSGFFLVDDARFGRAPRGRGYLAVFVPRGWSTISLQADTRRLAVNLDGRRLDGALAAAPAASSGFEALGRRWRVDAVADPTRGLRSALPWIALLWPGAAAVLALLIGRAILTRRRAERLVERVFDLSLELLCVADEERFHRVNPAFERTLGYTSEELLSRSFIDLVHPDDREATRAAAARLSAGHDVVRFENRYVCADGSICWLEWSTRSASDEGLVYGAARDVTERHRADDELRRVQRIVEASRDELRTLAEEQAALRRVATRVAQGGSPGEVFTAVATELAETLRAHAVGLLRFDGDAYATVVATHGLVLAGLESGAKLELDQSELTRAVRDRAATAWVDLTRAGVNSPLAGGPLQTIAGTPIVIEGMLWGMATAGWREPMDQVPVGTETRLVQFTELLGTAVANAEGRAQLTASRARVVAAGDETRRRIERDLHDGTQQRLVALALALRAAETRVGPGQEELQAELASTAEGLSAVVEELQEISRGLHPAILSKGGLVPAVRSLARRSAIPVELTADLPDRLPEPIEVGLYYVVSEALTNAAKHARASVITVTIGARDHAVWLAIDDDGVGGADPAGGSGLVGLRDRVEALGGTLEVRSPALRGTSLRVAIPLEQPALARRM